MEVNEKKETHSFIRQPKKASLLLNGNERSLFGVMIDYQQLIAGYEKTDSPEEIIRKQKISFDISISYLVKNLAITDKTVQKAINKLIEFNLINKRSGAKTRKKNCYSINFEKIRELDRLSNDQIFEMRDLFEKTKSRIPTKEYVKSIENTEINETIEVDNLINVEAVTIEPIIDEHQLYINELLGRYEEYIITKNGNKFETYRECLSSSYDFFNDKEMQEIRENRKSFKDRMILPYRLADTVCTELLLMVNPRETIGGLCFFN